LNKKKIAFVFGTRPEAIKMAPLINGMRSNPNYRVRVLLTGQHPEMARQVLDWFEIKPDIENIIDRADAGLNSLLSQIIKNVGIELTTQKPDLVIVQGDTTSAFAGAVAAFNLQIPVAHLEAGLRTQDMMSPYPEESYRQMLSRISSLHLCPTSGNQTNLLAEGIKENSTMVTGNTVVDALFEIQEKLSKNLLKLSLPKGTPDSNLVLVTVHRRENLENGIKEISTAIADLSNLYPELNFVIPMHPNPAIRAKLVPHLSDRSNVLLMEPLGYPEFITLLSRALFILTDSGGVQEEAPILNIPAFVMRTNTERPEGLTSGAVKLVGASYEDVVGLVNEIMADDSILESMIMAPNPYGDARATDRCISLVNEFFGLGKRVEEFQYD
jgi:UDP-N-acetylglucosamine 2-epimerase (non-hydrolysing)